MTKDELTVVIPSEVEESRHRTLRGNGAVPTKKRLVAASYWSRVTRLPAVALAKAGHSSLFLEGRGGGVGRGLGVGASLGVGVALGDAVDVGVAVEGGVTVAVAVAVAVTVGVAVGVAVAVAAAVGVEVGVGVGLCAAPQYLPPVFK